MEKIKVGIFGAGRGLDLAQYFKKLGCEIVAICDFNKSRLDLDQIESEHNAKTYMDFDEFINHGFDVVVLANFFHEHSKYAIKCFKKNIHVLCECLSNVTMAEGVELLSEFKNSKSIYMLAENYPQLIYNREIKKVCDSGTLGDFVYAEGEYNHPISAYDKFYMKNYNYHPTHWRNYLPRTYYLTHSLGPIMNATGATPKKVTAFPVFMPADKDEPNFSYVGDIASFIMTQNDDGSVFKFSASTNYGAYNSSYRIIGKKGQIENLRGMDDKIMLRYNPWDVPEGQQEINCYSAEWNDPDEEELKKGVGHSGADYLTVRYFLDCVKARKQPEFPFDIVSAVNMASVAILAHRSVLNGSIPFEIPDLTKEQDIKKYKDDNLSPFWQDNNPPTVPCCSRPDYKPTRKQVSLTFKLLKEEN